MKSNLERKYPTNLFIIGFLMNITKNFLLFFPAIILLIVGIWSKWCLVSGLVLLGIDVIVSLVEQIQIRNVTLRSDDPNFEEWQDAILSSEWQKNIRDLTKSKIEENITNENMEIR